MVTVDRMRKEKIYKFLSSRVFPNTTNQWLVRTVKEGYIIYDVPAVNKKLNKCSCLW